jgi:hypothetical protein
VTDSDNLHTTAEKFLREYLAQTGSKAFPVISARPASSAQQLAASKAAATDFIKQLHQTRKADAKSAKASSDRFEIEEPQLLVIAQRTNCTKYLYGFKASKPVFTHCLNLAVIIDSVEGERVQKVLAACGLETFLLPAPTERGSSLWLVRNEYLSRTSWLFA